MKRCLMIFAAAAALGGLISCDKERTPQNGDNSNQDGGDGAELTFEAAEAVGYFCGVGADGNGNALDYDMYLLSLQPEGVEMVESGYTGVGAAVLVDMNTPANGGNPMRILQGEYYSYKKICRKTIASILVIQTRMETYPRLMSIIARAQRSKVSIIL